MLTAFGRALIQLHRPWPPANRLAQHKPLLATHVQVVFGLQAGILHHARIRKG